VKRILFLFFDGLGLGDDDPARNAFALVDLPVLTSFTGGRRWLRGLPRFESERGTFIPTDACLGVEGKPQSATGQAAIMTGLNVPEAVGRHYGPKPDPEIAGIIRREGMIKKLVRAGLRVGLLNAYPSRFLEALDGGRRLPSSNQLAMRDAGVRLLDGQDFLDQRAMSVDFTGELWRGYPAENDAATIVWRTRMNWGDTPVMSPEEAGRHLATLARDYDLAFFDHWLTDYLGHRGTIDQAVGLLRVIEGVLEGLLGAWDDREGLIVITSDHGNFEDLLERGHTRNPVPTLIIGEARHAFADGLTDLTGFAGPILRALNGK
jgi:2,3-bisphosphoglycerate-independent phosphoglycerate mutase